MCGELEEDGSQAEEEFHGRFIAHTHSFLAALKKQGSDAPLHVHLDKLFRDILKTAADHTKAPDGVGGFERLAMEPLVFARIAGFMAAHLPLHEDPLKRVLEALMMGYAEGEIEIPTHDHDHDHDHGHGHSHGHGHGHTH
jgi:hypothetical protein